MRMCLFLLWGSLFLPAIGVPIDAYALADDDESDVAMDRATFEGLLSEVNAIFSQVALSFELRSYNVVANREWLRIGSKSKFLDVLDACPSTNGVPVYVFQSIEGADDGYALEDRGCGIEASAGSRALAHELGHMCGLADIYATVNTVPGGGASTEVFSVREEMAREELQPMDWGRCRKGTTQGDLIDRMLMCGHRYVNGPAGIDITAGDVYGVRIAPELVTNAITGEVSRRYEKGMAEVGFLLHGNRNPSRVISDE